MQGVKLYLLLLMRNAYKILVGNPEGKRPLEDLGVHGWIIF